MKFQKYTKHKASGVDWLGEIPEEWEVKRFIDLFSFNKGLSITKENLQENGIPCINYGEIHSKYGFEIIPEIHRLKFVSKKYLKSNKQCLLKYGDFVFSDTSEDIEGAGNFTYLNSNIRIFAGYHTVITKPIINFNYRYIAYLFNSITYKSQIQSRISGIKVYSITKRILKSSSVFLPPKQTQTKIANYLDEKTNLIDKKISLLQKKKQKYKELKQTLINEVVTKGLDKNVKMKNSEIEWIGEIPEHWEVKRLKDAFDFIKKRSYEDNPIILSLTQKGIIKRNMSTNKGQLASTYKGYIQINKGDIVLNTMDLRSGFVDSSKHNGIISPAYTSIRVKNNMNSQYANYFFQKHYFERIFFPFGKGVSIDNRWVLTTQVFIIWPIITPPKQEQIQIANYLDEKTKKIDDIMEKIDENIATLKEFRKTLINDAVTGKIKVA